MNEEYPALIVSPRIGDESFRSNGQPIEVKLLDFWRWAFSDLVSNATRGVLAEYIIAHALGIASGVRREWDACDLTSSSQLRIEVKSAAYLQSWGQKKLSDITFSIRPTQHIQEDNTLSTERKRQSDVYIFCLVHHQDKATLDPLNLDQWTFYLLPTGKLNEKYPEQKSLRLSTLMKMSPRVAKFNELAQCVEDFMGLRSLTNVDIAIE